MEKIGKKFKKIHYWLYWYLFFIIIIYKQRECEHFLNFFHKVLFVVQYSKFLVYPESSTFTRYRKKNAQTTKQITVYGFSKKVK